MKKSIKLIFCEKKKNDTQISGFAVVKKAPEKKICWKKKKILPALQIRPTKWCAEIF